MRGERRALFSDTPPGLCVRAATQVKKCFEFARAHCLDGNGPMFVEVKTYRYHGHHVGDAQTYRTRDEVGWWSDNKDPIRQLGDYMVKSKVTILDQLDALYDQIEQEVLDAIEFGKDAPFPPPEQAFEDIYA